MPDLLEVHRALLERWRTRTNLVGPGPLGPHYDDARLALAGLQPQGHWADLGTGAGFPGVVLAALHPELTLDLVDSRRKRCAFLQAVLAEAADALAARPARLQVLCTRLERLPDVSYDGLTARALAPPPKVLEHARRLLKPGGRVVLFLQGEAELPEAEGFEPERVTPYTVQGKARKSVVLRLRA